MKNRRFFLDVDPKSEGTFEKIGDFEYSIKRGTGDNEWEFNIEVNGEYLQGLILCSEELKALYNILTLEEKEPFDKEEFEYFWKRYHQITKMPMTDKEAAIKYWKRLTKRERGLADENIQPYYDAQKDKRYIKKCRTYLEDKNFNDEFKTSNIPSVGRNQSIDDIR